MKKADIVKLIFDSYPDNHLLFPSLDFIKRGDLGDIIGQLKKEYVGDPLFLFLTMEAADVFRGQPEASLTRTDIEEVQRAFELVRSDVGRVIAGLGNAARSLDKSNVRRGIS